MLRTMKQFWARSWDGRPPDSILLTMTIVTSVIMVIPFVYIIFRSLSAGGERWLQLLNEAIPRLLWNTVSLTVVVAGGAVLLGVSLAWFVTRSDLPGRRVWRWLLALPLVIPPYVGAMTYIILFGPSGALAKWWRTQPQLTALAPEWPINIYSFWGLALVLILFTFPYVYLIVCASLRNMNRNFEDIARSQGLNLWQIFRTINLPFLRPAIGAGAILVILYVLSDFGAVAIMRYTTFTAAIYYQMGSYDTTSAAILSFILIGMTMIVLWWEGRARHNVNQMTVSARPPEIRPLGKWRVPVTLFVGLVALVSVGIPLAVLLYWSSIGLKMGALNKEFWLFTWNSFQVAGATALISMVLALPLIYLKSRYPSWMTTLLDRLSYTGYALPGVIVALGLIFLLNRYVPFLYNTVFVIMIACMIRFLPQVMQAGGASLRLVSPRLDEASRSLGLSPWKVLFKVILPLILPGVLAGGALVFVSTLKELPATLLLRPPGFDTLAVRIWMEAGEGLYHLAAPAALLIVLIAVLPLKYMLD